MKLFIVFFILEISIFALPNKVVTGQIIPITINAYSSITGNFEDNDTSVLYKSNEIDKNIKLYEISEMKGNDIIVSFVSL